MLRQTTFVALALVVGAGELTAQRQGTFLTPGNEPTTRVGARGANFLEIGVGARAQALGGAFTGLASGATAMYWNPAGIGSMDGLTAAFSRSALYDDLDITHNFAAVGIPFAGGGIGVSYIRLDSGDIPRTNEDFPAGDDPAFGSTFDWAGTAFGLHYGRRLTDRLQVGFSGKLVTEGLDNASATWWGIDVGTMFNTGLYGITLGAALANIGSSAAYEGGLIKQRVNTAEAFPVALPVRFSTVSYQLPTTFRFSFLSNWVGGADALFSPSGTHSFKVALDLNDAVDTDLQASAGAEYSFREFIFLRGGKRFVNEANDDFRSFSDFLSFGGGIRLPVLGRRFAFDYAYTNMGELQNVQMFSFELGGN
ncbi:MAG TPA: PorV/PorQ family protein [Gemmatimonadales bacterium]